MTVRLILTLDSWDDAELIRNACATAANDAYWGMPPERKRSEWTTYHEKRATEADRLRHICKQCAVAGKTGKEQG